MTILIIPESIHPYLLANVWHMSWNYCKVYTSKERSMLFVHQWPQHEVRCIIQQQDLDRLNCNNSVTGLPRSCLLTMYYSLRHAPLKDHLIHGGWNLLPCAAAHLINFELIARHFTVIFSLSPTSCRNLQKSVEELSVQRLSLLPQNWRRKTTPHVFDLVMLIVASFTRLQKASMYVR